METQKFRRRGACRGIAVLLFLSFWLAGCDRGTDPEPEPEESNDLVVQPVVVSAIWKQELTNELNQSLAPLPDGGFAVAWTEGDPLYNRTIMMQWLDAQGGLRQKNGGQRVSISDGDADFAAVLARPAGGAYVAFTQVDGYSYQVKVQAFDQTMAPLWPEPVIAAVYDKGWENQDEPCLAPAPSGGVYVSFACSNQDQGYAIKCQRLDPAGNRLWGEAGITLGANYGFVTYPRAVADNSGGMIVLWMNLRDALAPVRERALVEGQRLTANGDTSWGDKPKVIHTTNTFARRGYSYTDFMAASDGSGGAVVAWYDDLDGNDSQLDLLAQRVNAAGEVWAQSVIVGDSARNCVPDNIIASTDGGAFISFREYVSESVIRLWMQRLGAKGEKRWGEMGVELSDPNAPRANYKVYGYFTGKFLNLCWTRQDVPYTFDFDVVMGRLKADGTLMDPPGGVILDDSEDKQFSRGMAYNQASAEYFVLWEDSRNSLTWDDFDIYGAILKKNLSSPASPRQGFPASAAPPPGRRAIPARFRLEKIKRPCDRPPCLAGEKIVFRKEGTGGAH